MEPRPTWRSAAIAPDAPGTPAPVVSFGLPAESLQSGGERLPTPGLRDHDHRGLPGAEAVDPRRRLSDPRALDIRRAAAQRVDEPSTADRDRPRRERQAEPAEARTPERQFTKQRRHDDLA